MSELDRIDRKILAELQRDASQTADVLSQRIGRSPSVIARRIRQLRADGVIVRQVAVLDPARAGFGVTALVTVYFERHEQQSLTRFKAGLAAHPRVQLMLDMAGEIDVVLLVVARDFAEYDAFADEVLEGDPAVRRFETHLVKKRRKVDLTVPLD